MKNKVTLMMWVAAAALAAYLAWTWVFPGPEKVIRKRIGEIEKLVSFGSNEGPLAKLNNPQKLLSHFASDVQVTINVAGGREINLTSREELQQAIMGARAQASSLRVEFHDVQVQVLASKTDATALLTVRADVVETGEPFIERMRLRFSKRDGDWLVSKVEHAPVVR